VALIDQPVDFAASPANVGLESRVERGEQTPEHADRDPVKESTLGPRHERLGHGGGSRQIDLPPAAAAA